MNNFTLDMILMMCVCIALLIGVFCFGLSIGRQSIKSFIIFTKNMSDEDYKSYVQNFNKSTFRYFLLGITHVLGSILLLLILLIL